MTQIQAEDKNIMKIKEIRITGLSGKFKIPVIFLTFVNLV